MAGLVGVVRATGVATVAVMAGLLTVLDAGVAVALIASADLGTWPQWVAIAYLAAATATVVHGLATRASPGSIAFRLLAINLVALPVTLVALSM